MAALWPGSISGGCEPRDPGGTETETGEEPEPRAANRVRLVPFIRKGVWQQACTCIGRGAKIWNCRQKRQAGLACPQEKGTDAIVPFLDTKEAPKARRLITPQEGDSHRAFFGFKGLNTPLKKNFSPGRKRMHVIRTGPAADTC